MKKLNRVLFISLLVLISTQTFAQRFGVQAGVNLTNMLWKDDDVNWSDELDVMSNLGFHAGVNFEAGFGDLISVEVAALLNSKGFKMEEGGDSWKVNLLYADVPVLLKVGPNLGPVKLFGAAGPYVGFGLTGKSVFEFDGEKESEDIEWGDGDEDDSKRLDYGAKFGVGAEVANFTFGAYYILGLANTATDNEGGYKENHRVISLSVGYKFGK